MNNFCEYNIHGILPVDSTESEKSTESFKSEKDPLYIVEHNSYLYSLKLYTVHNMKEIDILFRLKHPIIIHGIKILTNTCATANISDDENVLPILLPLVDGSFKNVHKNNIMSNQKIEIMYKLLSGLKYLYDNNIFNGKLRVLFHIDSLNDGIDIKPFLFYKSTNDDDMLSQLAKLFITLNNNSENNKLFDDLLFKMENYYPIDDIINHEIFRDTNMVIISENIDVKLTGEYPPDTHDIVKNMILYIKENFSLWDVEFLFLAIELYRRVVPNYFDYSNYERKIISYACIYIASQFSNFYKDIKTFKVPEIKESDTLNVLMSRTKEIVVILNGVLNVNKWYHKARNLKDLIKIYNDIIINKDLYIYQNIQDFQNIQESGEKNKRILVKNFLKQ
jgi:hypothetical protein